MEDLCVICGVEDVSDLGTQVCYKCSKSIDEMKQTSILDGDALKTEKLNIKECRRVTIMTRLILLLIRKKLRVKKYEAFRFANQKSKYDYYFFTSNRLMKHGSSFG